MAAAKKSSFFRNNGLSIVVALLMLGSMCGQYITGWHEYNKERQEEGRTAISAPAYFTTGHFVSATFENWESEFLQMGLYVLLTIWLFQKGSSESKDPEKPGEEEVDREPKSGPDAPWPVKRGGAWLWLYKNSLSGAFFVLFVLSFWLHFTGSLARHNDEAAMKGMALASAGEYIGDSEFWFESFQNWQSEFLSVISIVVLSIFLRQKGSPESKPVDAPDSETGSG